VLRLALLALVPACAYGAALDVRHQSAQFTIDADPASIGFTYAPRISPHVLVGGGGGFGLSPFLGTTFATGNHFDATPNVHLLEVVNLQAFARFELLPTLRVDTGARAGAFIHGSENFDGGPFAEVFVAPGLVWRWLWVGPRVSAGLLSETAGPREVALTIDYLMLRYVASW